MNKSKLTKSSLKLRKIIEGIFKKAFTNKARVVRFKADSAGMLSVTEHKTENGPARSNLHLFEAELAFDVVAEIKKMCGLNAKENTESQSAMYPITGPGYSHILKVITRPASRTADPNLVLVKI